MNRWISLSIAGILTFQAWGQVPDARIFHAAPILSVTAISESAVIPPVVFSDRTQTSAAYWTRQTLGIAFIGVFSVIALHSQPIKKPVTKSASAPRLSAAAQKRADALAATKLKEGLEKLDAALAATTLADQHNQEEWQSAFMSFSQLTVNNDLKEKHPEILRALLQTFVQTLFNDPSAVMPTPLKALKAAEEAFATQRQALTDLQGIAQKMIAASRLKPAVLKPFSDRLTGIDSKIKKIKDDAGTQAQTSNVRTNSSYYLLQNAYDGQGRFTVLQYQARVVQLGPQRYRLEFNKRTKKFDLSQWTGETDTAEPERHLYGDEFSSIETIPRFDMAEVVKAIFVSPSEPALQPQTQAPTPITRTAPIKGVDRLVRWYSLHSASELQNYFTPLYAQLQKADNFGFTIRSETKTLHQEITASLIQALSVLTGVTDAPSTPSPLLLRTALGNGAFEAAWNLVHTYSERPDALRQVSAELAGDSNAVTERWKKLPALAGQSDLDRWIQAVKEELIDRLAHRAARDIGLHAPRILFVNA